MINTRWHPCDFSYDKDNEKIVENIMNKKINWDLLKKSNIDPALFNLIELLLNENREKRISSRKMCQEHEYFRGNIILII